MSKQIPVYEITVDTVANGRMKVLTLEPGQHHVPNPRSRGYYENDKPVGYITIEDNPS